jgi:hypothetical protein
MLTIAGGILLAVLILILIFVFPEILAFAGIMLVGGAALIAIVALVILASSLGSTGIALLIAVILGLALGYVSRLKPKEPFADPRSQDPLNDAKAKSGARAKMEAWRRLPPSRRGPRPSA